MDKSKYFLYELMYAGRVFAVSNSVYVAYLFGHNSDYLNVLDVYRPGIYRLRRSLNRVDAVRITFIGGES